MLNKRSLIVILVVVLLMLVGGAVLYFSITAEQDPEDAPGGLGRFFPFLDDRDTQDPDDDVGAPADTGDQTPPDDSGTEAPVPQFRQVWAEPVAGATFGVDGGGDTVVRFVERATGHVYQASASTTRTERLTNTTIPKIQEVVWVSQDRLLLRYLRDDGGGDIIETFAGTVVLPEILEATTTEEERVGALSGSFLPLNIQHVDAQSDGTLFYLRETVSGIGGFTSSFDGSSAVGVFSSPVRDWLVEWVDSTTVALTTKASSGVPGHLVFLNTQTGAQTPMLSSIGGLTTLVGDDSVLYAAHRGSGVPELFSYSLETGRTLPLSVGAFAEKCVWSNTDTSVAFCAVPRNTLGFTLPDEWYQGVAHFDDTLWQIDASAPSAEQVFDPRTFTNTPFDVIDISVDETGSYLLFRNKTDSSLWLYQLTVLLPEDVEEER